MMHTRYMSSHRAFERKGLISPVSSSNEVIVVDRDRRNRQIAQSCRGSVYLAGKTSLGTAPMLDQLLEYYVAQSKLEDISYYFDEPLDWRLRFLVPMCHDLYPNGQTLKNLFACLRCLVHTLRIDLV